MDHNPFLAARSRASPETPSKGEIERPGEGANLAWQTRVAPPTDYENRLGDALERVFADGAETLEEVVAGLNSANCFSPSGAPWDAATFESEIRRLGA